MGLFDLFKKKKDDTSNMNQDAKGMNMADSTVPPPPVSTMPDPTTNPTAGATPPSGGMPVQPGNDKPGATPAT